MLWDVASEEKEKRNVTCGDSDEVRKTAREQKDNVDLIHCRKVHTD